MTEDEAKTKWCPFVRIESYERTNSYNRHSDGDASTNVLKCIGSACMAWRWDTSTWSLQSDDKGLLMRRSADMEEPYGFCGLAGNP